MHRSPQKPPVCVRPEGQGDRGSDSQGCPCPNPWTSQCRGHFADVIKLGTLGWGRLPWTVQVGPMASRGAL